MFIYVVLLCIATWFDYVCLLTGSVCGVGCLKLRAVFDLLVFALDWCGSRLLPVCSLACCFVFSSVEFCGC